MGLIIIPLCRGCGAEDKNSAHALCECEALASLRHTHLLGHQITGHKVPSQKVYVHCDQKGSNTLTIPLYSIQHFLCD